MDDDAMTKADEKKLKECIAVYVKKGKTEEEARSICGAAIYGRKKAGETAAGLTKGCKGKSPGAEAKYKRCVAHVKAKGKTGTNAYAVCRYLLD